MEKQRNEQNTVTKLQEDRKRNRNLNGEILALLDKYGADTKRALKENKKLEYLYALAPLRENLLEWYNFRGDTRLLQVGADFGALTGLYLRGTGNVTVLDESEENLEVVQVRYQGTAGLNFVCDKLTSFAAGTENAGSYHYVTIIGALSGEEETKKQIDAARQLLVPGGALIFAACNQFGLKYFAGTQRDAVSITKKKAKELLPGGKFYYPMPDYRFPSSIYSEQYLPKKGDLTGMPALYDFPKYLLMDVGAAFDAVCEDGQFENFANSFLVIWNKGE